MATNKGRHSSALVGKFVSVDDDDVPVHPGRPGSLAANSLSSSGLILRFVVLLTDKSNYFNY